MRRFLGSGLGWRCGETLTGSRLAGSEGVIGGGGIEGSQDPSITVVAANVGTE